MSNSNDDAMPMVVFLMGLLTILVAVITGVATHSAWENSSVESGHAEWYIEKHEKKWRWKAIPTEAEKEKNP